MTDAHTSTHKKLAAAVDPAEFTPFYAWKNGERNVNADGHGNRRTLFCEGVALEEIAREVGTPAYVYSRASIEAAYRALDRLLAGLPHTICYAMKANGNLSVLRVLAELGSSFDIVSGGELDRLRRVGVPGERIVFSGVGKTRDEIRAGLEYPGISKGKLHGGSKTGKRGVLLFNIESEAELDAFVEEAARHVEKGGTPPNAAIRVNPNVMAGGHPHIATGQYHHKFGIDWHPARRLYLAHKDSRWIAWRGISAHIGSQILSVAPYRQAVKRLVSYAKDLTRNGIRVEYLDVGGGLGVRYTHEEALVKAEYARMLKQETAGLGCRVLIEPGRSIVGPAGVLLARVLYVKENGAKKFVIVDGAINDLIRPALYGATHAITAAAQNGTRREKPQRVDVVGPICESGDFWAKDWPLAPVKSGDLLVVWTAGAYGSTLSSNYNARRRAAEVLVDGKKFRVARKRQTYDDLVRGEEAF